MVTWIHRTLAFTCLTSTVCGTPSHNAASSSESTGGAPATSATDGTTGKECAEVYPGDLSIGPDTPEADLATLDQIGRIDGSLGVQRTLFHDLSLLGCLGALGSTSLIGWNDELTTLAGLERLEHVARIEIIGNNALTSLAALQSIRELDDLYIRGNADLSDLGLNALESVDELFVGECGVDEADLPDGAYTSLTEINGLASLTSIRTVEVAGQVDLVSLGRLHVIAAAGGITGGVGIFNNHNLPYAEVEQLEAEVGRPIGHCGNKDDPFPLCSDPDSPFPGQCRGGR